MGRQVVNIKDIQRKSLARGVRQISKEEFRVESEMYPGRLYRVVRNGDGGLRCSCPWASYGGLNCKHVLAVKRVLAAGNGDRLSFWLKEEDARRQKRRMVLEDGVFVTMRFR